MVQPWINHGCLIMVFTFLTFRHWKIPSFLVVYLHYWQKTVHTNQRYCLWFICDCLIVSLMEVTLVLFYLFYLLTQSLSGSQRLNLSSLQITQTFSLKSIFLINTISYNLNSTFLQIIV